MPCLSRAAGLHGPHWSRRACARLAASAPPPPPPRVALAAAAALALVLALWTPLCRALGALQRAQRGVDAAEVHVATLHAFGTLSAAGMLDELWFIGRLFPRPLVPLPAWLPLETQLAAADLVLVSVYGPRERLEEAMRAHPRASILFLSGENLAVSADFWDHLVPLADLSMGQRHDADLRATAAAAGARYSRIPWWLPYTLDRDAPGRCPLPAALLRAGGGGSGGGGGGGGGAAEWRARPGFAGMLTSHYNYPRRGLFEAFSKVGRVVSAGGALNNAAWPADLPSGAQQAHLVGKPLFLRRFRFNICPENSLSLSTDEEGGYNTEKLPQALAAGAVPIYWGDSLERDVFNPARILRFNGSFSAVVSAAMRLETDAAAADAFFAQPVLMPTAQAWVDEWCDRTAEHFSWLAQRIDARRRVPRSDSDFSAARLPRG